MANVGKDGKYDCAFLDADGKEIGLMLTKTSKGLPSYSESFNDALAQQSYIGAPGYSYMKPQIEIPAVQWDFSHGFGQEYMDNESKYFTSTNVDCRFKNMVIPGPLATGIAKPTTYVSTPLNVVDGNLEIWTSATELTNWTETGAGTLMQSGAPGVYRGTYSAIMTGTSDFTIYQDCAGFVNATHKGALVKVIARVACDDVTKARGQVTIDDGVGTTTASATVAAQSGYEEVIATRTLDDTGSCSRLRIILTYDYVSATSPVYFDDVRVYMTYVGAPSWVVEFNDLLYYAMGSCIYKLNGTGDGFTFVYNTYFPITHLSVVGEYLVASCGDGVPLTEYYGTGAVLPMGGGAYFYGNTSETFVQSTIAPVGDPSGAGICDFLSSVGDVPYKTLQPNIIRTAVGNSIINGSSYATAITVGDSTNLITAPVMDLNGTPIIFKEDMPYYIDSSSTVQRLAPELNSEKSTTSGKNAIVWQGCAYIPCGTQALWEYDGSTQALTDISPSSYITNSTDFDGQIVALAHDAKYLFAIVDNGTKIEVLAGRWESFEDEGTKWVWHPISEITLTGCQYAMASTVYARRLWICSTSVSDSIYYLPLPSQYGSLTTDTSYSFTSGGNVVTSWHHLNFRSDKKAWVKISLTMSGTTADIYWRAYYEKLGDTTWTEIESTNKFKTSPTTTAYLPQDVSSNEPSSTMMRFKFEPVTNVATTVPILLVVDVRTVWYPSVKKIAQCQVRVDDNIRLRDAQTDDSQTAASIRTALDELANPTECWPRTFYPPYWESNSDTKYVKLLPPQLVTISDEKAPNNIAYAYNLEMLFVDGVTF